MSSPNNTVDLPTEILYEIFFRLPSLKPVYRFRCVSKLWNSLLTEPSFINRYQKSEGKPTPRDNMLLLLEKWDFTFPETKAKVIGRYFKYVERKVKDNIGKDELLEELEHAKKLAEKVAAEFHKHDLHDSFIQCEKARANRRLLQIEWFIWKITEEKVYVSEEHKDWISGIMTKYVDNYHLVDSLYYIWGEEGEYVKILLEEGVGKKTNEEKVSPEKVSEKYFEEYTSMEDAAKDGYMKTKRDEHKVWQDKVEKECKLDLMLADINKNFSAKLYSREAGNILGLLSDTIESYAV